MGTPNDNAILGCKTIAFLFFGVLLVAAGVGVIILMIAAAVAGPGEATVVVQGVPVAGQTGAAIFWVGVVVFFVIGVIMVIVGLILIAMGIWDLIMLILNLSGQGGGAAFAFSPNSSRTASPRLPFPMPPGLDAETLFGSGFGWLSLLFLTEEERKKLPPSVLEFIECLREFLCNLACKDASQGTDGKDKNPAKVVVDVATALLADLKAQLDAARQGLADATKNHDIATAAYWQGKIKDLTAQIAKLGG